MTFASEIQVRATRKRHRCEGCGKMIEAGEPAINWAGMVDGDFCSAHYHPECRAAEIGLNERQRTFGDEWQSLRDADAEDYPWLKSHHPVAYRRLVQPAAQDRAPE